MNENPQDRNVDQIRDILFGGQMRDYERRFVELTQRVDDENSRLRQEMEKRLGMLDKRLDAEFDKLGKALKQETADRTQGVDDLESRTLQAQRTMRAELQGAVKSLENDLGTREARLREELGELQQQLLDRASELRAALGRSDQDLRADKVGRSDLAALLTEVALRLKGEFELPLARK